MADSLQRELRQKRAFDSLEQATFLSVQRTASVWMQTFARRLKPFGLTPTQYNVLRILRGAHPGSLTCGEIGERMVTPVPDVTRLVDRLVARRLAWKGRDERDRRVVRVEISGRGLELLSTLDERVLGWLEELLAPLEEGELETLCRLSEKGRDAKRGRPPEKGRLSEQGRL
jgi:DNA-binding MarR family transcriptional regulator